MTAIRKISLESIAGDAADYVDEAAALALDGGALQIVEEVAPGVYSIVDGFHRTAGQIRWCRENDVPPAEAAVEVVVCDDPDLISAAAEPGPGQAEAIAAIYEQAGL